MENSSPPESSMLRRTPEPSMLSSPSHRIDNKPKKLPTVTPRRFNRFFAPRNAQPNTSQVTRSTRMPLGDISGSGANRQLASSPIKQSRKLLDQDEDGSSSFGSVAERSSPVKRICLKPPRERSQKAPIFHSQEIPSSPPAFTEPVKQILPRAIKRSTVRHVYGSSSRRETVDPEYTSKVQDAGFQAPNWQSQSAFFYSRPYDQHVTWSCEDGNQGRRAIPFSVAAANQNELVAVSDEEGFVRLLDCRYERHNASAETPFQKAVLELGAHANAILDLEFSEDDSRLVTASGDRTALVIDMHTHQEQYILFGHKSSLRQARFQPGSRGDIVATAGRDGMVNIWDLRCAPTALPRAVGSRTKQTNPVMLRKYAEWVHRFMPPVLVPKDPQRRGYNANDVEKSVTALSFLDVTMPHIIMTGSATSAGVSLWDMRQMRLRDNSGANAFLNAAFPDSLDKSSRGVVSMALSSDASRLYALCKDSILYTYSTSQMRQSSSPVDALYGFKSPAFQVNNFYTGLSVRQTDQSSPTELIAVAGGSQGPVIIPNDERHLEQYGGKVKACGKKQNLNLYSYGSVLKHGHTADLCGVAFTRDGSLVSVGDDARCRLWFDDQKEFVKRKKMARETSEYKTWCYAEPIQKSDQAYYDMNEEW